MTGAHPRALARPSRRHLIAAGAGVAVAPTVASPPAVYAAGAAVPQPGSYPGTPVLGAADRHLVSRFSYGVSTSLTRQVRAAGGAQAWFDRQLRPLQIADDAASRTEHWWPDLGLGPEELWKRSSSNIRQGWRVACDYQRWVLTRRAMSQRQVLEVMTEFWENHLNVPVAGDQWFTWRASYGRLVRSHALGRYSDLLAATITHPAMQLHLNGANSTKEHPNENLGRELLELHTVGRIYSEDDVKNSARILTGYHIDVFGTWRASYRAADHWRGRVKVLGFTHPNSSGDGRPVTRAYLRYLAHHPATARRIATKLAVKFVRDDPPSALVERLAKVYLDHDTAIVPVLRTLVASREFKAAIDAKVRTPAEDVIATYRVLGVRTSRPPRPDDASGANARLFQVYNLGESPLAWPRPDGAPIDNAAWSSPSRILAAFKVHFQMSAGRVPNVNITFRKPADWLPKASIRFDDLVDHLSRSVLARASTGPLLAACCTATGLRPADLITKDHLLVRSQWPRLLTTLLDAPVGFVR